MTDPAATNRRDAEHCVPPPDPEFPVGTLRRLVDPVDERVHGKIVIRTAAGGAYRWVDVSDAYVSDCRCADCRLDGVDWQLNGFTHDYVLRYSEPVGNLYDLTEASGRQAGTANPASTDR